MNVMQNITKSSKELFHKFFLLHQTPKTSLRPFPDLYAYYSWLPCFCFTEQIENNLSECPSHILPSTCIHVHVLCLFFCFYGRHTWVPSKSKPATCTLEFIHSYTLKSIQQHFFLQLFHQFVPF